MTAQEPKPRPLTTEEAHKEWLAATARARDRTTGSVGPVLPDFSRMFGSRAERDGLREASCDTCTMRPPCGKCPDYDLLYMYDQLLSFPSTNIRRTESGVVECRNYCFVGSREAVAASENPQA